MKQLKSRSQDLRSLFQKSITIEYVAEPLQSVSAEAEVSEILEWMAARDFDVVGVERGDTVSGYVDRSILSRGKFGKCGDYEQVFKPSELIAVSTPLIELMPLLQKTSRLFVLDCNQLSGIVTCGDLQKAPVRMLLFGSITLLEMNLLRIIRLYYPQDSWQPILKPERLEAAKLLWQASQERNEATDLLDYLQFCDKRDLVLHQTELIDRLKLTSKRSGARLLKHAEQLRNRLAHAQNIVNGSSWQELITLAADIEQLLICCEQIN
jgi:predicted transcriptional regulator